MRGLFRLEGQIIDSEERPVEGARVRLQPGEQFTATDAHGSFVFDRLAARRYWVSAHKDDFYAGPMLVRIEDSNQRVSLRMHRGATLMVHVSAERAPAVGAKLVFAEQTVEVSTDDQGTAIVHGLAPHVREGWLIATGWAPKAIRVHPHTDPAKVVEHFVRLQRGASVEGVVLGPGLQPEPDATIRLCSMTGGWWIDGPTTHDDGRWHLDLPEGWFRIAAVSARYGPVKEWDVLCDGRTQQSEIVLRVDARRALSGIVVDKHGQPVPNAWVGAVGAGGVTHNACADEKGAFALSGLSVSAHHFYANTWSKASPVKRVRSGRSGPIWRLLRRVQQVRPITLVAEDARIAGIVIDENGEPIADARVHVFSSKGWNRFPTEALTNASGRFDFGALEPDDYTVRAIVPPTTFDDDHSEGQVVHTDSTEVKLVLATGAPITGRVLLNGKPLPYYAIAFCEREPFRGGRTAVHDVNGRFALRLDPGTWRLTLGGPGTRLKTLDEVTIERGQQIAFGDVVMEPGQRIAGHVRDRSGAPVVGAQVIIGIGPGLFDGAVHVERWYVGHHETRTDSAGAYRFDSVDARTGHGRLIWATHPASGASILRELPQDDAIIDLELLGSGRIDGVVEGMRGGRPLVFARRSDEPERARWQMPRQRGEFHFDDLPPGDYVVSLRVPNSVQTSPVSVIVVDGQVARSKIVMVTSSVQLEVKVPEGRGRDLVLASADDSTPEPEEAKPRFVIREARNATETVTFDHLQPGKYRASIDGQTWTRIDVAPSPEEQRAEIKGAG